MEETKAGYLGSFGLLQQNYCRLGGYLFLTVLQDCKRKIQMLVDSVSDESPLPGSQMLCFHGVLTGREFFWVCSVRALIPFMGAPSLCLNHLSKTPPFSYHHIGA